jgi:hypothetical protein
MSRRTDTIWLDDAVYAEEHIKQVLLRNIEESTWLEPTPIQMQALPIMLQGRVGALLLSTPCLSKSSSFLTVLASRHPTCSIFTSSASFLWRVGYSGLGTYRVG